MKFHINHTISSPAPTSLPVGGRLTTLPRPRLLGSQAAALAADKQHHGEATQQQQRQAFEQLAEWLTEKGGSVSGITAGDCQMGPVTVRGLIATQVRVHKLVAQTVCEVKGGNHQHLQCVYQQGSIYAERQHNTV